MRIKSILAFCSILILGIVAGCTSSQLQTASNDAANLQQKTQAVANATTQPGVGLLETIVPAATPVIDTAKVALEGIVGLLGLTSAGLAVLAKSKSNAAAQMQAVATSAADKAVTAQQGIQEVFSDALNWKNPTVPWSQAVGDLLTEMGLEKPAAA